MVGMVRARRVGSVQNLPLSAQMIITAQRRMKWRWFLWSFFLRDRYAIKAAFMDEHKKKQLTKDIT
jgi:hypothetical protein